MAAAGLRSWAEHASLLEVARRAASGLRNGGLRKGLNGGGRYADERAEAAQREAEEKSVTLDSFQQAELEKQVKKKAKHLTSKI